MIHITLTIFVSLTAYLMYENSQLHDALKTAELNLGLARSANETLVTSVQTQNDELAKLRKKLQEADDAADQASQDVLDELAGQLAEDHQAGTEPDDMNRWMEALFK